MKWTKEITSGNKFRIIFDYNEMSESIECIGECYIDNEWKSFIKQTYTYTNNVETMKEIYYNVFFSLKNSVNKYYKLNKIINELSDNIEEIYDSEN